MWCAQGLAMWCAQSLAMWCEQSSAMWCAQSLAVWCAQSLAMWWCQICYYISNFNDKDYKKENVYFVFGFYSKNLIIAVFPIIYAKSQIPQ